MFFAHPRTVTGPFRDSRGGRFIRGQLRVSSSKTGAQLKGQRKGPKTLTFAPPARA